MPWADLSPASPSAGGVPGGRRLVWYSADPAEIDALGAHLAGRGYVVEHAVSIPEAVAAITIGSAELLLCDDSGTGDAMHHLLTRLRAGGLGGPPVPVLAISGSEHPARMAALRRAGADDILVKPVDVETMEALIRSRLGLADRLRAAAVLRAAVPSRVRGEPSRAESRAAPARAEPRADRATGTSWMRLAERLSFGIILASGGRVLFANRAARDLATRGGGKLIEWARTQSRASMRAASPAPDGEITGFRILPPGSAPGAPDTAMFLAHLDLGPTESGANCMATLLFPSDWPSHGTELMSRALGLTPAETVVAGHLATGRRPDEIAHLVSVTLTTVNYHLRNIYQKSGTSRQSDTVRLLRSVPLAAPSPSPGLSGQAAAQPDARRS